MECRVFPGKLGGHWSSEEEVDTISLVQLKDHSGCRGECG